MKILLFAMMLALAGCSSEPEIRDIANIKEDLMDNYQASNVIIEGNQHLMITMTLPEDSDLERAANIGFNRMGDMLSHVLSRYPELDSKATQIYVTFDAKLLDRYNNESKEPVFDVFFDVPELKKFKIDDTLTFYDYLRHADISIRRPIGHDIIETWCAGDTNKQDFKNIC